MSNKLQAKNNKSQKFDEKNEYMCTEWSNQKY